MIVHDRLPPGKYKLTVDDFVRLDKTGVFGTTRTELLDGDIIIMNAEYRPHAWVAGELGYRIRRALEVIGSDLWVMSASVALSDHDMPLPDIVLTTEPRGAGPIPLGSVALIVEVASSTLDRDMGKKLALYAKAGVSEYWVVDLNARTIHQRWKRQGETYADRRTVAFGDRIEAATIAGLTVDTDSL